MPPCDFVNYQDGGDSWHGLLLAGLPYGNVELLLSLGDPSGGLQHPLCIAVRHPGTPLSHDEAVNH